MNMYLPGMEGEQRHADLSQWYTPPWLAEKLWWWWLDWFDARSVYREQVRVLEPAAGDGALLRPALASQRLVKLTAVEIDASKVARLIERMPGDSGPADFASGRAGELLWRVIKDDFLSLAPGGLLIACGPFDVALMNPPYEDGKDVAFIREALRYTSDVVGIFRSAIVHGDERFETLWRFTDVVRGVWLTGRPSFGQGDKSESAKSDFVVLHLTDRATERKRGEPLNLQMEWW